jgi:hypothetical protein
MDTPVGYVPFSHYTCTNIHHTDPVPTLRADYIPEILLTIPFRIHILFFLCSIEKPADEDIPKL